jgi:hypothetical protein
VIDYGLMLWSPTRYLEELACNPAQVDSPALPLCLNPVRLPSEVACNMCARSLMKHAELRQNMTSAPPPPPCPNLKFTGLAQIVGQL